MKDLTVYESILLMVILRLEENAYGVTIREEASKIKGRTISYGTIYSYLDQLTRKGYVTKKMGKPTAERGGRKKIFYTLSQGGIKALKSAYNLQSTIWKDAPAVLDKA
ncbi:MAG: PadR family transcriptional regulator [Candidatus Aminicenantes bacterium]|nr:MAG: PadR family transcriptional regulator [Candidatus Aminicenantes bacterium]